MPKAALTSTASAFTHSHPAAIPARGQRERIVQALARRPAPVLAALLALCLQPGTAQAEEPYPSAQLSRHVMPPLPSDGIALSQPDAPGHLGMSGRLHVDYANDPLVFEAAAGDSSSERFALVSHQAVAQLGFGLGLFDDFAVFASLPLQLAIVGHKLPGQPQSNRALVGDLRLGGRAVIADEGSLSAALQLALTASTSPDSTRAPGVAGESGTTVHAQALGRYRNGAVSVTANLGIYLRKDKTFSRTTFSNEFTFGLGGYYDLSPQFKLLVETFGNSPLANVGAPDTTAIEALFGGRLALPPFLTTSLSMGTGLLRGYGSPDLRIIAGVGATWDGSQGKPNAGEPENAGAEPEYATSDDSSEDDAFEPLLDQPARTTAPVESREQPVAQAPVAKPAALATGAGTGASQPTPLAPATLPAAAPTAATALAPAAPTGDADGDGLTGSADACPRAPGPARLDGCPRYVRLSDTDIQLLDALRFASGRAVLRGRGKAALAEVAAIMKLNPTLYLQIEGHAGDAGRAHEQLSRARATAVFDTLIEMGCSPSRLKAVQCGTQYPLAPMGTSWGSSSNERMEFRLHEGEAPPRDGCQAL